MTDRLPEYKPRMYAGMSFKAASMRAQDVCERAGRTGQTILATEHLSELADVMQRHCPDGL